MLIWRREIVLSSLEMNIFPKECEEKYDQSCLWWKSLKYMFTSGNCLRNFSRNQILLALVATEDARENCVVWHNLRNAPTPHNLTVVAEGHFTPKIPYTSSKNPEKIRKKSEKIHEILKIRWNPSKSKKFEKSFKNHRNPSKIHRNPSQSFTRKGSLPRSKWRTAKAMTAITVSVYLSFISRNYWTTLYFHLYARVYAKFFFNIKGTLSKLLM